QDRRASGTYRPQSLQSMRLQLSEVYFFVVSGTPHRHTYGYCYYSVCCCCFQVLFGRNLSLTMYGKGGAFAMTEVSLSVWVLRMMNCARCISPTTERHDRQVFLLAISRHR